MDLLEVRKSKQRYYDIQSDVMQSKYHNFETNLNTFVEFCEKDPAMVKITEPLKENKSVNVVKWYDDIFKTGGSMVGSKRYVLPSDPDQEASILYQFLLGIHAGTFRFQQFTIGVYGRTRFDEAVYEFSNDIFRKMFRYLGHRLDSLEAEYEKKMPTQSQKASPSAPSQVFIVHGHDNPMLDSVELLVRKMGLEPIILSDQRAEGLTIIEKFEKHSQVPHAIVLLSPDDKGCKKDEPSEKAMTRARQNVVLELGFFTGKLGRHGVTVVHKTVADFEMPSDYHGVEYIPYDDKNDWKLKLAKELERAGFKVDFSKI